MDRYASDRTINEAIAGGGLVVVAQWEAKEGQADKVADILARFLPEWQGIDRSPPGGAGVDRLREVLIPLQGLALTPETWERDVLPRRSTTPG